MKKTYTAWEKLFLGFGILTIVSGIYLIFQKDYVAGISGSLVGILLIFFMTMKQTKNK